jgi:Arm DNA-binding domain
MLTERRIEKLTPPAGVQELNVRDEPGLVLRVRRNADGSVSRSWAFWRVRGGRKERAKIGAWPAIGLIEARRQADHFRKMASSGVRVTKEIAPTATAASVNTVGDLFDLWLRMYATPRHKDKGARVRWLLDKHAGVIRSVPLAALTKQHITLTVLPLVGRGHHKTAADLFTLLRQVTSFATRHDFLMADPAGALRRSDLVPPKNAPRERVLDEAELKRLAVAVVEKRMVGPKGREFKQAAVSPIVAAAIFAQLATAARPGEIGKATWKEFDLKAGTWKIPSRWKPSNC